MGSPPPTGHRLPLQTSLAEWQSSWGCPREPRYPTAPAGGWTSALLPWHSDHRCCWVPAEQCPRVTTARSRNSQGAPRCRRGQELLFSMGRGWDKSEEARLLGRRALFRAQVAREDCSSSSCVKAQRALAPPRSSWESISWKTSPLCSGALRFLPLSARGARAQAAGQRMEQRGGAAKFAGYRFNSSSPDAPRDLHGSRKKI